MPLALVASGIQRPYLLIALFAASWQAALPFIPITASSLGMGTAAIGVLFGMHGLAGLLAILPASAIIMRIGAKTSVAWAAAGACASFLLILVGSSPPSLYVALILFGVCQSLMFISCKLIIVSTPEPRQRDHAVGMLMFYTGVGVTLGPTLGSIAVRITDEIYSAFLVATVAAAIALLATSLVKPPLLGTGSTSQTNGGIYLSRLGGLLPATSKILASLISTAIGDFVYVAWVVILPLAMHAAGHDPAIIGWVFTARGALSTLVRPLLGVLLAKISHEVLTAVSVAIIAAGFILSSGTPGSLVLVFAGAMMLGVGTGLVFPLGVLLITADVDPLRVPSLLAIGQLVGRIGTIAAPLVTGALVGIDPAITLSLVAGLGLGAGIWIYGAREKQQT